MFSKIKVNIAGPPNIVIAPQKNLGHKILKCCIKNVSLPFNIFSLPLPHPHKSKVEIALMKVPNPQ